MMTPERLYFQHLKNDMGPVMRTGTQFGIATMSAEELIEITDCEIDEVVDSDIIVRAFSSDVTMKADEERVVVAKISTTSVDREGDVVLPSGLKLQDFRKNPVVLLNHDSGRLPIGRALAVKRTSDAVIAKVQFAARPAEHPESAEWIPDTVHSLFKQGILRAFSVGFIPTDMRPANDKDQKRYGEDVRRIITQWKLMEFSVVPIPANQDALALEVAKSSRWLANAWHLKASRPRLVVDQPSCFKICGPVKNDS